MNTPPAKVLRVGFQDKARNLTPATAFDVESSLVLRQVFEAPFGIVYGTTDVEPRLFREGLRAAGRDTYEAEVRGDIVFSDGSPLTAEDVARCLGEAALVQQQATVRTEGRRVVFTLKRPNPRFDMVLSHLQCSVFRRSPDGRLLGTGAYVLDPASPDDLLRLTRNPRFRKPVAIEEIHFRTYPLGADGRSTAMLRAIEAGEVDLSLSLSRDDIDAVVGARKMVQPGLSTAMLFINAESPNLREPRLRQAIAHSVDRMELTKTSYSNPLAFMATGITPRALARTDDSLGFNLTRAKALLAQAGPVPARLDLLMTWGPRPYLPHPQKVARLLVEQIGALGIRVEPRQTTSSADFTEAIIAGKQDLTLGGWVASIVDPCDFLEAVLHSERIPNRENALVACNDGHLRSAEMDAALARYRADRSPDSLAKIVQIVNATAPLVPLMHGPSALARSDRVLGLKPSPLWFAPVEELDLRL